MNDSIIGLISPADKHSLTLKLEAPSRLKHLAFGVKRKIVGCRDSDRPKSHFAGDDTRWLEMWAFWKCGPSHWDSKESFELGLKLV